MTLYIKGFALALSALITLPLAAEEDVLLYFYEPSLSLEHQETFSRMVNHANNAEFARARTHSERLIAAHEAAEEHNRELYGKLLINHGIIDSADFARITSDMPSSAHSFIAESMTMRENASRAANTPGTSLVIDIAPALTR